MYSIQVVQTLNITFSPLLKRTNALESFHIHQEIAWNIIRTYVLTLMDECIDILVRKIVDTDFAPQADVKEGVIWKKSGKGRVS